MTEAEIDATRADVRRAAELDAALPPMHYSTEINRHCATTKPDGNGSVVLQAHPLTCECKFYGATTTASALTEARTLLVTLAGRCRDLLADRGRLVRDNGFAVRIMEAIRKYSEGDTEALFGMGVPWVDALLRDREQLREQVVAKDALILSQADRIHAQSALLSRKAEAGAS